jgi:hypothetical protein
MHKTAAVSLALVLLAQPLSALACSAPKDISALKTAALQQRLMVAALSCRASASYNRFVVAHRDELQRSDADLKAYFIAENGEHGEAAYDAYKTRVANLAAHAPAVDNRAFCAATDREFDALSASPDGLIHALAAEPMPANVCKAPVLAAAMPQPAPKAAPRPLQVAAAEVVGGVGAAPPVLPKSAPLKVTVEVAGVTAAAVPAMPYSAAPPPVARMTREEDAIDPADIVPPESYAQDSRAASDRGDEAPRATARRDAEDDYAPADRRERSRYDDAPPRFAYASRRDVERYDDYAPPAPAYVRNAPRSDRYWYYRNLYARPGAYRD